MRPWKWGVVLLCVSCSGPTQPGPVPNPNPNPTPIPVPTPNTAPQILSITVSTQRAEIGDTVTVTANVVDAETLPENLKYEWKAAAGTITGTGRVITWKAPGATGVGTHRISLTVVETYGTAVPQQEHRVTGESPIIKVEDSMAAVQALALQFLGDFADSKLSPEYCIRNFTDTCKGKEDERKDIENNRKILDILSHKISIASATVDAPRLKATVVASCEFTSKYKVDGHLEFAKGLCTMTLVYLEDRWWLCTSTFKALNSAALNFIF